MNAETSLKNAIAAGYDRLSPRDVMLCVLEGAGGGATGSGVLEGSGSPVGVVSPISIGQIYSDYTTPGLWQSTGLTSADWTQLI